MNMEAAGVAHYSAEFDARAGSLPGADIDWLQNLRRRAMDRFVALGFPGRRDESWKYTRVASIEKRGFRPVDKPCVGLDEDDIERFLVSDTDCHRLVFVNGRFTRLLSRPGRLPDAVELYSIAKLLGEDAQALQSCLSAQASGGTQAFAALNTAFMHDGALLHLGRGCRLELPVHLLFLSTPQDDMVSHPRVLVVADEGSEATVIESYAALGDAVYFNNAFTEIRLAPCARLRHLRLQQESGKSFHIATVEVSQGRDSHYHSLALSAGAVLARTDINCRLEGTGADCVLDGLYLASGRQHVDFHTNVEHLQPCGSSRERYKGIIGGRGRGVFNGRVHVHPDAQKTDARQSNANLLLSRDAEVDTKPELEIFANDVQCAHGATIGQLDENMVFYLRSRGLDEATARGLLTWGFAREIVDAVDDENVREWLADAALAALPDGNRVRRLLS